MGRIGARALTQEEEEEEEERMHKPSEICRPKNQHMAEKSPPCHSGPVLGGTPMYEVAFSLRQRLVLAATIHGCITFCRSCSGLYT